MKKYTHIYALLLPLVLNASCKGKELNRNNVQADLLNEQKLLKDSVNNIHDRIEGYMHRGHYDSAEAAKLEIGTIHARLIGIQSSIDSIGKER